MGNWAFNFKEVSGKDPLLWFALSIRKDMYDYSSYIDYIHDIGMACPSIELCFVSIKNSNMRFNIFIISLICFVNVF